MLMGEPLAISLAGPDTIAATGREELTIWSCQGVQYPYTVCALLVSIGGPGEASSDHSSISSRFEQ